MKKIVTIFFSIGKYLLRFLSTALFLIKKISYYGFLLIVPFLIIWFVVGKVTDALEFSDHDEQRGAAAIDDDPFDAPVTREKIKYLRQNWKDSDSLWFYNATQGSNLLPYDFFLFLEQSNSKELFRSNANINRYRYLPQIKTDSNPHALPVGMAKDVYKGKEYMGFTCAACHTSQINYNGYGIRIDGGPAASDMENFLIDLAHALQTTLDSKENNPEKIDRFHRLVLDEGSYKNIKMIDKDLDRYARRIRNYTENSHPSWVEKGKKGETHYGFSRLDAFGRIYNRVLQHSISSTTLYDVLAETLSPNVFSSIDQKLISIKKQSDQTNIFEKMWFVLEEELSDVSEELRKAQLSDVRSEIFNSANAPASYPYLWDIAQHDYVQWTGLVSNGGLGPLGRNVGQVIGVFGTLDWQVKNGWTFNSILAGQGIGSRYIDFESSIDKRNLGRVEQHLRKLHSPEWPQDILPKIDPERKDRGKVLFDEYCAACHTNIDRISKSRRVIAHISKVKSVGTDSVLADNTVSYLGHSGVLQGQYVDGELGKTVIQKNSLVAPLVKLATQNVVTEWDPDKNPVRRAAEWIWDFIKTLNNNKVKTTLRMGDYVPATTANPLAPNHSYKARSLNGIWATAPYLHNGSIPNLYELLLPKWKKGDPEKDQNGNTIEYRSNQFYVGSREFKPEVVGFKKEKYDGFLFDTNIRGNSNVGHEYAAGKTVLPNKKPLPKLDLEQRLDLLEYLKTL